jgi:hypothetical protein
MSLRAGRAMIGVAAMAMLAAMSLAAEEEHIFKGKICLGADGRPAMAGKSQVLSSCTDAHPKRGAHYVLISTENEAVYHLDEHKVSRAFAGNNVVVVGTLDQRSSTIHVDQILRAMPPVVAQGKSVYIDCDTCVRGMAAAWLAAFEQLTDWGRFDVVADPKKADLVFLLSANPYLGDYVTRDGPDKRPVRVDITYMNVVDPRTGVSLWADSRQWGSWFVDRATKDLILEFKEQLALDEHTRKDYNARTNLDRH